MKEFLLRRDGVARLVGPAAARADFEVTLETARREGAKLVFFATTLDRDGTEIVGATWSMNEYACVEVWRAMAVAMLRDGRVDGGDLHRALHEAVDHVRSTGG